MAEPLAAADFSAAMEHCVAQGAPWPAALAVSGGGDSLALMLLAADWAVRTSRPLPIVLTVDHGLIPDSSRIARSVVERAKLLGLRAHAFVWRGNKPKADIEAASRIARYRLMGNWCIDHHIEGVFVAHTLEDQAETFLLRLARGSGLDGLAAMRSVSLYPLPGYDRLRVVRPLLGIRRTALRNYLESRGESWSEDPMNSDARFARVRLRQAWPRLEELGLSAGRVAAASFHLARARDALEAATAQLLGEACRFHGDRVVLDGARFAAAPPEIGLRALAHILSRLSGEAYRPRFERLGRLYSAIRDGQLKSARTLHGCRIGRAPKAAAIFGPASLMVTPEPGRASVSPPDVAARGQIS